jgi:O-glycosyl hydrolase
MLCILGFQPMLFGNLRFSNNSKQQTHMVRFKFSRRIFMKRRKLVAGISGILLAFIFAGCDMNYEDRDEGDAATPQITQQPTGGTYSVGETIAPLTVTATVNGGTLSYQWFTADSETSEGGTAIQDATDTSFTPNLTEDGVYYYYVVVTNTNNNVTGTKTATAASNPAKITLNDSSNAVFPTITVQPQGGSYPYTGPSTNITPLAVTASVSDGGILSYQWYSNTTASNTGGTVIPPATGNTYQPVVSEAGTYYYYVVVTNTNTAVEGRTQSPVSSNPVTITVITGSSPDIPVITAQPQDDIYLASDTIAPLTVTATITSGALTYQWYSNTTASNLGGTVITGATSASYTPPLNLNTEVTLYYYVVVTNTNQYTVIKTSTVTSRPAKIRIQVNPGAASANATITVDTATKYQYVRGFGGMAIIWTNFPDFDVNDMETMFNPDTGLGYNMLRIMIPCDNTDIGESLDNITNGLTFNENNIDNRDYYDLVKVANRYNGYVLASPWSPPKEWKTNNSINGDGRLMTGYYGDYAAYLKAFCQKMYDNGAPIYAVSIQNEPNYPSDYDGCQWSNNEMRDFFKQAGHFTDGVPGYGGGSSIPAVYTMNGESANNTNINDAAMNDPESRAVIDIIGRHVYGNQQSDYWGGSVINKEKEVWMTEHNINGGNATTYPNDSTWNYVWKFMNDVDLSIRLNNESAFIWWAAKRFYSMMGDGQYGTANHEILPRGYGLSHYAKFANETTRVDLTVSGSTGTGAAISASNLNNGSFYVDSTAVKATAFESPDGNSISLVLYTPTNTSGSNGVNMGTIKIDLPENFTVRSAYAMRSSASVKAAIEEVAISADRKSAYVTLPANEILSVKFTK